MNEGKGLMFKVAQDYNNKIINKQIFNKICKENNWGYEKDKTFGIIIFPLLQRKRR